MAIVKADDTFCHGKPNAEAVFFRTLGPIKAFEYMRQILLRNCLLYTSKQRVFVIRVFDIAVGGVRTDKFPVALFVIEHLPRCV